jgi:hypothetical protein
MSNDQLCGLCFVGNFWLTRKTLCFKKNSYLCFFKSFFMYPDLLRYVLPCEIVDYFDLVNLHTLGDTLHFHLDEKPVVPAEYQGLNLSSNGFYETSTVKDFPLRDKKVVLHLRRRRWVDEAGKSYSRQWDLVAEGTRYSKEFAFFLKEAFGYLPDSSPIS